MDQKSEHYEFVRDIEVEQSNVKLKLVQHSIGDVGCVVWDAGIVLGKYLDYQEKLGNSVINKKVIDIGSGTGVAGLFAAALGAKVILTDLPEIIPILEKNIQSNCKALKGSVSAAVLKWGEMDTKFTAPDLILVSDCIYYDMSVEKLIPTLEELAGSDTEILISYEDRELGNKRELLKTFLHKLRSLFEIEIVSESQQHPDYQSRDIHLLKCKKKKC